MQDPTSGLCPQESTIYRANSICQVTKWKTFQIHHKFFFEYFRAQDRPCSVVIKPTKGNFLHDYQNRNHLHIGVTNSKGFVVEYDAQGIHRDKTLDWKNCIVISLNGAIDQDVREDPDWPEYWDMCLEVRYIPRNTLVYQKYQIVDHIVHSLCKTLKKSHFTTLPLVT